MKWLADKTLEWFYTLKGLVLIIATEAGPILMLAIAILFAFRLGQPQTDSRFAQMVYTSVPALFSLMAVLAWASWFLHRGQVNRERQAKRYQLIFGAVGFIYLLRRQDGVYKIGKTFYLSERLRQHERGYGMKFKVVKMWPTKNVDRMERVALWQTGQFAFAEGNRQELRKMNLWQILSFIIRFGWVVKRVNR